MKEGCQSIVLIGKGSRHDRRPFHIEHGTDQVGFGAVGAANVDCLPGKSAESALRMCRICSRFSVPVSTLIDGYGVHTHSLAKARDVRSAPMASIVAHPPPPPRFHVPFVPDWYCSRLVWNTILCAGVKRNLLLRHHIYSLQGLRPPTRDTRRKDSRWPPSSFQIT
jgi:hypothetical protein